MSFVASAPLIAYKERKKAKDKVNLFEFGAETPATVVSSDDEIHDEKEETYVPHLKQEFNLHLIFEAGIYKSRADLIP